MRVTVQGFGDPIDQAIAGGCPDRELADAVKVGALVAEVIDRDEITDDLREQWQALSADAGSPNPFYAPWFLEPALRHLTDPSGTVRLVVFRRRDSGKLIAIAPFVLQKGYAKLPLRHICFWSHAHCFNGAPLIRRGYDVAAYCAIFDWLDTRPGGAGFLRLPNLPFDHKSRQAVAEAAHIRGRSYQVQSRHERAVLGSQSDFDTVIANAMSGKKRKELRRQANRLADLGETAFVDLPLEDGTAIADFLELENAGWKSADPHGFPLARSDAETAFFREAMLAGAEAKAVTCTALTLNGAPKAMLFSLRAGDRLSAFKTTYDESLSAYSPGVRLLIDATRRLLDAPDGVDVFDSCAKQDHPVVDGLWPERLPIVQINIPAAGRADRGFLRTAATIEGIKNRALRRLNREEV